MPVITKRSADQWKRELQGKPADVAHELIVADGTVEAYEAFVALFMQSRFAHEAHEWLILHRRMLAWNDAVLVNTAASYGAFLALYPDSDLAATSRKLIDRLRYRPSVLPAVMAATGGSSGSGNAQPASSGPSQPTNASLGPCASPTVPLRKVDVTPQPTDPQPPVRVTVLRPREPDPVVRTVVPPPHPRQIVAEGPVYHRPPVLYRPIGMGFGGGGFRGPMGFGRMRGRF
jgi:hypothetical protein